jgi:hypothetical protein
VAQDRLGKFGRRDAIEKRIAQGKVILRGLESRHDGKR